MLLSMMRDFTIKGMPLSLYRYSFFFEVATKCHRDTTTCTPRALPRVRRATENPIFDPLLFAEKKETGETERVNFGNWKNK